MFLICNVFVIRMNSIIHKPARTRRGEIFRFAVGRSRVHFSSRVILKDCTASLLGAQQKRGRVENQLAGLFVVSLGKALD